ncbi:MAG: recombinase family protein, partial [Pirellulaceae bacterium]|nr:recombinase family protein [Pirellulaceae bacterium]
MLKRHFDPKLFYRCVVYLRMSTDQQNRRSPDQQLDQIKSRLKAMGYPWTIVKIYRDDGKSGRYLRNRPGYQKMMRDIKAGSVTADLILVDTIERFGRVEELPTIRKQLFDIYGVLILTADVNFDDPTSPAGKALGAFEMMRATEDGRIKAHNVLRGKRDAARQGHWPGGPVPFGFRLENVMKQVNGCQEVDHRVLVPDPAKAWIIKLLFETALDTGFGQTRLARFLNSHADIATSLKPFQPPSIGYWLDN